MSDKSTKYLLAMPTWLYMAIRQRADEEMMSAAAWMRRRLAAAAGFADELTEDDEKE